MLKLSGICEGCTCGCSTARQCQVMTLALSGSRLHWRMPTPSQGILTCTQ